VPAAAALSAATAAALAAAFPKATARVALPPEAMPAALGSALKGDEVMEGLRQRLAERSLPRDLPGRLVVVQRAGERHADLVAQSRSPLEARRLVTAWRDSVFELEDWERRNLAAEADLDDDSDWTPYHGGGGPDPELSRTTNPDVVTDGDDAVLVFFRNTERVPRSKYVWSEDTIPVSPGSTYRISAVVSGEAGADSPIRLGVRLGDGTVTQAGLTALEGGLTMRATGLRRLLHGLFTVPHGTTGIQVALWRDLLPPGAVGRIAIADVRVVRSRAVHVSGFDEDTAGWIGYHGNGGPPPALSTTSDPRVVEAGSGALAVVANNPEPVERSKFVWAGTPVPVKPGEAYELTAVVSGEATEEAPLRLGLRYDSGAVTQEQIAPIGEGVTKNDGRARVRLHGRFVTPPDVAAIQPVVWRDLRPRMRTSFAVDDVRIVRSRTLLAERFESREPA
jgi:hypothetical protein